MWNICIIMYMATAYMFIYKSTKRAFYFKGGERFLIYFREKTRICVYDEERTRATMNENDFYS